MTETPIELPTDDPPRGPWTDPHAPLEEMTDAEVAEGNRLGATIDVDDDEDNGGMS